MRLQEINYLICFIALIVFSLSGDVHAKRKRKIKDKHCHSSKLERCLKPIEKLDCNPGLSVLMTSDAGWKTMCSTFQREVIDCFDGYFKKCGTVLHRDVMSMGLDLFKHNLQSGFCNETHPLRSDFLNHATCMQDKVYSNTKYIQKCNFGLLLGLDQMEGHADPYSVGCCSMHQGWIGCMKQAVGEECGPRAVELWYDFMAKEYTTVPRFFCPEDTFTKEYCEPFMPKDGAKLSRGKKRTMIVKYIMKHYPCFWPEHLAP